MPRETMRLILAKKFISAYFDKGSAPDPRTVRSWVETNEVPGRIVGKQTYIDADAWETGAPADLDPAVAALVTRAMAA